MRYKRLLVTGAVLWLGVCLAAKKKKSDDFTQTLDLPKDPPSVAIAETRRLIFHVSPLSGKGLLTQQTRDALKAILKETGGLPVIHIRAFVAGSGDVRRIPQIVSEVVGDKRMPLPSVSVLRAGGLPLENAQVVLETVSVAKRDVNTSGLGFIVSDTFTELDPASSTKPLLQKSLDQLAAKLGGSDALRVSCFVSTMGNPAELSAAISSRFPSAVVDLVQPQRSPFHALAVCEAVARGTQVTSARLAFTGTRVAFGAEQKDASLAFQRLDRDLTEAGAPPANIVFSHIYPLSGPIAEMARKLRPSGAPMVIVPFEGFASIDAGFAVDAVAAVAN